MKILVPLDGSELSEAVLPTVSSLAAMKGVEVTLVTVIDASEVRATWVRAPAPVALYGGGLDTLGQAAPAPMLEKVAVESVDQAAQRAMDEATNYLETVARKHCSAARRTVILGHDGVADELDAYVRREGIDLIAMATHGRSGVGRLLMGSVADSLLRRSEVPVLLVRPRHLGP